MTLLKDNNFKDINVALLSLEADIKNKITGFDTSVIDKQLAEINSRIDKINDGSNNTSDEIEDINYKLNSNSNKIKNIERNIEDIDTKIDDIEQKLSDIFSAENKVTDFNTTTNSGIYYWIIDAANRPSNYGVLLVNKYDSGSGSTWINQIAYGTNNKIYFRQNINSGNWTDWKAVAFEGELNALTVNGKTYDGSEAVDAGVQTVENGGTGVTTQADINKAFIGNLTVGNDNVTDGTEFVSSFASDNGFAEPSAINKPYKRQFVKVWNYIKDKISSVLGLTKDNYGGKASTAGNADTVDNYHASQLWRSDGATWNPSANVVMTPSGNGSEWSFDFRNKNGATGTYWQVWDENKNTLLQVNADDGKVSAPYGFVGNLSGKADTAGTADKTVNDIHIGIPYVSESGQYVIPLGNILPPGSADYNSPYNWDITGFFSIIRPSGHAGLHITFAAGHGYSHGFTTYAYLDEDKFIESGSVRASIKAFQYNGEWWLGLWITTQWQGYDSKMTVTYSRGLPATPTCILYNSISGGVANAEIYNSIQDIPSWWWKERVIYNPTTFTTAKASSKMVIPIGAPSSLEDGCIWIER